MYRFYSVTTLPQVHEWQAVVALAKQSDVIFNGIDMGALFDAALNGLSLELGIPLVRIYVYMSVYLSVYVCYCIYKMTPIVFFILALIMLIPHPLSCPPLISLGCVGLLYYIYRCKGSRSHGLRGKMHIHQQHTLGHTVLGVKCSSIPRWLMATCKLFLRRALIY